MTTQNPEERLRRMLEEAGVTEDDLSSEVLRALRERAGFTDPSAGSEPALSQPKGQPPSPQPRPDRRMPGLVSPEERRARQEGLRPRGESSPWNALGALAGIPGQPLQAFAELGTRGTEASGFLSGPIGDIIRASGGDFAPGVTQVPSLEPLQDTPADVLRLAALNEERPLAQQIVGGAVFDPLNVLPGVGFGGSILRGAGLRGAAAASRTPATIGLQPGLLERTGNLLRTGSIRSADELTHPQLFPVRAPGPSAQAGIFGQAPPPPPPGPLARRIPEAAGGARPTGPEIVEGLGRRFAQGRVNRAAANQFLQENVRPAFFQQFDDAPVMDLTNRGGEWMLEVTEAGWQNRIEDAFGIRPLRWRETAGGTPSGINPNDPSPFYRLFDMPQGGDFPGAGGLGGSTPPTEGGVGQLTEGFVEGVTREAPEAAETFQRVPFRSREAAESPLASVPEIAPKTAHIESAAPDGPRGIGQLTETPTRVTPELVSDPASLLQRAQAGQMPGERIDQAALRLHEAALNTAERQANDIVRLGNNKLRQAGIGIRRGATIAPRPQDIPEIDQLYTALHNPSRVAAGEITVPPRLQAMYDELRSVTDWEEAARLDFDPDMATVEDYFYRGWKAPEGMFADTGGGSGSLVRRPSFQKPRVGATYEEMREAGFEPLFWNPYEQWKVSRMQGIRYRQQMELVDTLKQMGDELARPHDGGPIPEGWRVPRVGPAFEGKPFATTDATGNPTVMHTRRWMVPDEVANPLESMYGVRPSIGRVAVAGRRIDLMKWVDWAVFLPKRAKLFGSFFQQIDFLNRGGVGAFTGMVDGLFAGEPVRAVRHLAHYPRTAADIVGSYFIPAWRRSMRQQLNDAAPLFRDRPGITMKNISDSGLSITDVTILPRNIDQVVREAAQEAGITRAMKSPWRAINNLEGAMRRGLFDGVYPAAIINDVRHNIAPVAARLYPDLTDAQLSSTIAQLANKRYSSIPASQTVVQNRVIRESARRAFFSINESEGLLRQATGVIRGSNKRFWAENWLGVYLYLITTANIIHFASTGEPLPLDRYTPISKTEYGPLPIGYNVSFASPNIPFTGRGGTHILLDLVGQLDTAFKVLDPASFITARTSVPVRALENQIQAEDFYGTPIDDVGPGGVVSRTTQLAQDLASPIGFGQAGLNILAQKVPESEAFFSSGEEKLGIGGQLIQASGLNVRGETIDEGLRRRHPNFDNFHPDIQQELRSRLIEEIYGPRTRLDMERFQEQIWEVFPPTEEQREQFQQRMDQRFGR